MRRRSATGRYGWGGGVGVGVLLGGGCVPGGVVPGSGGSGNGAAAGGGVGFGSNWFSSTDDGVLEDISESTKARKRNADPPHQLVFVSRFPAWREPKS